jgi:hypothetical protein
MKNKSFLSFPSGNICRSFSYMKFTIALILVYSLSLSAVGLSQISFTATDKTIREVLEIIEKQSHYRFFYNDDIIPANIVVSMDVKNQSIQCVLDKLFERTEISFQIKDNDLIAITLKERTDRAGGGNITNDSVVKALTGVTVNVRTISPVTFYRHKESGASSLNR